MLDPIDNHLAANDDDKRRQHLPRPQPGGQDGETRRQNRRRVQGEAAGSDVLAAGSGDGEAAHLDHVAHTDNKQHDPKLEALHNIGAGELEVVFLFEALEDGTLDLDKLVGQQQCEEGIGVRVDGHVERNNLVKQDDRVDRVVDEGQKKHAERKHDLGAARAVP